MFFWNSLAFFNDPVDVGNLISGSSAFSKTSLNIWKFTVHVLLKPGLENFQYYFASVWDECNCAVVWAFFGIAVLGDWKENWPFPILWPLLSFPNLLTYWVQHFHSCDDHFILYSYIESLYGKPPTNRMLYANYISIKKRQFVYLIHFYNKSSGLF